MVSWRMRYTKWAIGPTTIFKRTSKVMMLFTKISRTATMISGLSAAFVALPSDILMSMNLTIVLSTSYLFDCALFTNEILFSPVHHLVA